MAVEQQAAAFKQDVTRLRSEIQKVMVGQQEVIDGVLICVLAGGHGLLEGVPGLGKTMLIRTLADALDLHFSRIQFTPDLMPADIVGTNILVEDESGRKEFRFQTGPIFANIILADEINRATPKTQSAMLEAMQEHSVTVAGVVRKLAPPFFVLATQNPIEQEGTYPLPEAQLDRFMFKLLVGPPNLEELNAIVDRTTSTVYPRAEPVLSGPRLLEMREFVREIPIAKHVQELALKLVLASHPNTEYATPLVTQFIRFGASPRAAQSIVLAAKVRALLDGRYNVAFDDVAAMAKPALRHRMLLNFEGEAEGITTDRIIDEMIISLRAKTGQEVQV
ncbi:MAG: AAA family ATPase [Armatimonadota bacterium]